MSGPLPAIIFALGMSWHSLLLLQVSDDGGRRTHMNEHSLKIMSLRHEVMAMHPHILLQVSILVVGRFGGLASQVSLLRILAAICDGALQLTGRSFVGTATARVPQELQMLSLVALLSLQSLLCKSLGSSC